MGDSLPSKIATDVPNVVLDRGGTTGLTSQVFPGACGNEDGTWSVFITHTRQGHLGHLG